MRIYNICRVFLALILLSSCSDEKGDRNKSPVKVTLKIHAWSGYVLEYIDAYKKYAESEYGLLVDVIYTPTSGHESNVKNIRDGSKADIVSPSNDIILPLVREKLIVPLDTSRLKNFRQINPVILETGCYIADGTTYAVPFNFGPYAIAYNKSRVPEPRSYRVLWDRKYRKRVSIPGEYDTINIYMAALMLGIPREEIFNLNSRQLSLVESKLRELCAYQVKEYWKDNLNPESSDSIDIGMDWGIGVNKINSKTPDSWGFVIPEEGATGWIDTWSITRNAVTYDVLVAAYAWIDFMISAEIQARMARVTSYGPINPYAGRYLSAEEKKMYYLNYPDFVKKFILWQPLKPEVFKRYRETWKRIKK